MKYDRLHDFNVRSVSSIAQFLDIDTVIEYDNNRFISFEDKLDQMFRDSDYNSLIKKKIERVISLCKMEECSCYINAINGQQLYKKSEFAKYGIELMFVKTDPLIRYRQFSANYIPNLSIIDVLMHNGKEGTKQILTRYELI